MKNILVLILFCLFIYTILDFILYLVCKYVKKLKFKNYFDFIKNYNKVLSEYKRDNSNTRDN